MRLPRLERVGWPRIAYRYLIILNIINTYPIKIFIIKRLAFIINIFIINTLFAESYIINTFIIINYIINNYIINSFIINIFLIRAFYN